MLTTINIGTTGLNGFTKELETISNNVANLNTPSFKSSKSQFTALFSNSGQGSATGQNGKPVGQTGYGLGTLPSVINFEQGQLNQTGQDLDVAIDGEGLFVLRDASGAILYSRDGSFSFDSKGVLVNSSGAKVLGMDAHGNLHDITTTGLSLNPALPTTTITVAGRLLSAESTKILNGINVIDKLGASHALTVELANTGSVLAGSWKVSVKDGTTVIGEGELRFTEGRVDAAYSDIAFKYTPAGLSEMDLTLRFGPEVTSPASGTSSLAVSTIDGHGEGSLVKTTFDKLGNLVLSYSNGETVKQQQLALARPSSTDDLVVASGNSYKSVRPNAVSLGVAAEGQTTITADYLEGSNVDLSSEFSAIIVTQRGYQASSQLISTANEMLDTLLRMKG